MGREIVCGHRLGRRIAPTLRGFSARSEDGMGQEWRNDVQDEEHWSSWARKGLNRRQVLRGAALGGAATAGLALLGCGNKSSGGATGGASSNNQPKRGGSIALSE